VLGGRGEGDDDNVFTIRCKTCTWQSNAGSKHTGSMPRPSRPLQHHVVISKMANQSNSSIHRELSAFFSNATIRLWRFKKHSKVFSFIKLFRVNPLGRCDYNCYTRVLITAACISFTSISLSLFLPLFII